MGAHKKRSGKDAKEYYRICRELHEIGKQPKVMRRKINPTKTSSGVRFTDRRVIL